MTVANLRWMFEAQPESAHPTVVVHDSDGVIVTFEAGGSVAMHSQRAKGGPRGRNLLAGSAPSGFSPMQWSGDGVVRVHREGDPWSVWRWLSPLGEWSAHFYVNLEQPWVRTSTGFDTEDWILDLVVDETLAWRFKDEDELDWAQQTGRYDANRIAEVRAAAQDAIATIEAAGWPFDADWNRWLPDQSVAVPTLRDGWESLSL